MASRLLAVVVGAGLLAGAAVARAAADPLVGAAHGEQRYVLAEFVSTTCPACDEMQPVVQQVLARYPQVLLRTVDADREVDLSRRYAVKCVPVYVVLDPQGKVVFNDVGTRTAEELGTTLEQAGAGGR